MALSNRTPEERLATSRRARALAKEKFNPTEEWKSAQDFVSSQTTFPGSQQNKMLAQQVGPGGILDMSGKPKNVIQSAQANPNIYAEVSPSAMKKSLTPTDNYLADVSRHSTELLGRVGKAGRDYGLLGGLGQLANEAYSGLSQTVGVGADLSKQGLKMLSPLVIGEKGTEAVFGKEPVETPPTASPAARKLAPTGETVGPMLPEGVQKSAVPGIFENRSLTPEQEKEYGKAIFSDTPQGATREGFEQDLARFGAGVSARGGTVASDNPNRTGRDNIDPETGLYRGEAERLKQLRAERAAEAPGAAISPQRGLTRPEYPRAGPYEQDKILRSLAVDTRGIMEDMRRGRLSAEEGKTALSGLQYNAGQALGMSPDELGRVQSVDYATDARVLTEGNNAQAAFERQALANEGALAAALAGREPTKPLTPSAVTLKGTNEEGYDEEVMAGYFDPTGKFVDLRNQRVSPEEALAMLKADPTNEQLRKYYALHYGDIPEGL